MTVSFEQARRIAYDRNITGWQAAGHKGDYMVAAYGFENERVWLIIDGAREYLEDEDYHYVPTGRPVTLVDKVTGEAFDRHFQQDPDVFDAMIPVGVRPE
jgi:hypothetical protein